MKKKIALPLLCAAALTLSSLTACEPRTDVITIDIPVATSNLLKNTAEAPELYENVFSDDRIANQWKDYGIGDPYIYRFDGRYYLLCSTRYNAKGVKGWTSTDLYIGKRSITA